MANNCYNYIEFSGKKEDVKALKNIILVDKEIKLAKVIPLKDGASLDDAYKNWGTKWFDVSNFEFYEDLTGGYIVFDTAWSPSLPLTREISKRFNLKIRHEYEEGGNDFEGYSLFENGKVIESEETEYRPYCSICDEKCLTKDMIYDEENYEYVCKECVKKDIELLARLTL